VPQSYAPQAPNGAPDPRGHMRAPRRERAGIRPARGYIPELKSAPVRRTAVRRPTISPTKEKTRDVGPACRLTIATGLGVRL